MFFQIDFTNGLAVYDQVVRQVKFAVAAKLLKEGELVPSVRDLAHELTLNPNTVSRAYRQLQDDGVLTSVRGTGLAVAAGACSRCCDERMEIVGSRLKQVFIEARQSHLDRQTLRKIVERQLAESEAENLRSSKDQP
jgi:GntR family transcriptional regulator